MIISSFLISRNINLPLSLASLSFSLSLSPPLSAHALSIFGIILSVHPRRSSCLTVLLSALYFLEAFYLPSPHLHPRNIVLSLPSPPPTSVSGMSLFLLIQLIIFLLFSPSLSVSLLRSHQHPRQFSLKLWRQLRLLHPGLLLSLW